MVSTTESSADKIQKGSTLSAWVLVLFFFVLWEAIVRLVNVPVYILPAPSVVFLTIAKNISTYANGTLLTVGEAVLGLLLGMIAGTLLASLLVFYPKLEGGVMTLAILMKSTPLVAIAPLLTLWLGFGIMPKIIITALMTFFPVLVNVLVGLQKVDPALIDLFRSWHASRSQIFFHLRIPSSLPNLFAAIKISAPLALIGAVVAEWTGASGGLGKTMWLAYTNLNLPFLFAAIFILAAIGILIYWLLIRLESWIIFWQLDTQNL